MSQDQADYLTEGNLAKKPTSQAEDYRAFVGPAATFDVMSALQFNLLTTLGLREHHSLLDIGCGSLRAGRLFIPYLLPERYFGVEPNDWLIDEGIRNEVGKDVIEMKRPAFSNSADFAFETFDQSFDFIIAQSIFSHASLAQEDRAIDLGHCLLRGDEDAHGDGQVVRRCYRGNFTCSRNWRRWERPCAKIAARWTPPPPLPLAPPPSPPSPPWLPLWGWV